MTVVCELVWWFKEFLVGFSSSFGLFGVQGYYIGLVYVIEYCSLWDWRGQVVNFFDSANYIVTRKCYDISINIRNRSFFQLKRNSHTRTKCRKTCDTTISLISKQCELWCVARILVGEERIERPSVPLSRKLPFSPLDF